jgi:hypothetical protein
MTIGAACAARPAKGMAAAACSRRLRAALIVVFIVPVHCAGNAPPSTARLIALQASALPWLSPTEVRLAVS